MPAAIRFETPENIQVQYHVAGLGTRFVAWFLDQLLVWVVTFLLIILMVIAGASFSIVFDAFADRQKENSRQEIEYAVGVIVLVWGLGSFLYFGVLELFMRGQTVGKRACGIRVVKAGGFQLDASSIVVRNVFRVVDHMPPMWLVPLVTRLSQRAGDLVAGTLVVADGAASLSASRSTLAERKIADAQFHFDRARLAKLSPGDVAAVERLVDRFGTLPAEQQQNLADQFCSRLAGKLGVPAPPPEQSLAFLEDLLVAEFRRQDRKLV